VRFCLLVLFAVVSFCQDVPAPYSEVLKTLGRKGDFKDNVLKINVPRTDLSVVVDGVAVPTPFGFGGWLAMEQGSHGAVMMGDLVLLESEVNPVMSALLDNGLEVSALHNHFFFEQPRMFYMHVMGHGDPQALAAEVKPALDLIGKNVPADARAHPPAPPPSGTLDTAHLAQILGHAGEQNGAVYKVTIGRPDLHMVEMGAPINARMGLNTWAAFFGSDSSAVVAGDVAMLENEVTPVLKSLRASGLQVVAIHHHMIRSNPTIIFLHYWGKGPAEKLAAGVKSALDQLGGAKP
jgi:Domain of Unknown Function (DUF1259)